ncbi:hypothetical protein BYT27DRAFT_7179675 [Phlegmacium glaucopus]|nr:hypothetical protein BYT27DRAFT_7179675 [Phlegmacium glaucopus]
MSFSSLCLRYGTWYCFVPLTFKTLCVVGLRPNLRKVLMLGAAVIRSPVTPCWRPPRQ